MKTLVFGSLNIDHVYQVPHFLRPGETMDSSAYSRNAGGKGLNQAIALARAGQDTAFAGAIGQDGLFLRDALQEANVDTQHLQLLDTPTGHAIIQVETAGGNAILLFGGANRCITREMAQATLSHFVPGDCVLLQNEISCGRDILLLAKEKGLRVALNPSPASPDLKEWPLELVDWLILNEVEGQDLTGFADPQAMLDTLCSAYPKAAIVLTLGRDGAWYRDAHQQLHQPAVPVQAVDTTAAGDTFTGYFLQAVLTGQPPAFAMALAAHGAALAVTRPGAGTSIPTADETLAFMNQKA
ncbi:MAG: ribokinase [Clostridiales bacterium]|nr:ribokinase [Clostridiales bacterium]